MMKATSMVTFTGIRNGVMTPVAIMWLPFGSAFIIGLASTSKISAAQRTRHRKTMTIASAALTTRLRNSTRWEMNVSSVPLVVFSSAMSQSATE